MTATELSPLVHYRKSRGLSQKTFGKRLGLSGSGTISKWEKGQVPAERVLEVERETGIPRHLIRPDLYPDPAKEKVRA